MNKGLFCDTCDDGPFRNSNGLRGHKQFAHGVPPKPTGDGSQKARSLETRPSKELGLLKNVVAQMLITIAGNYPIYCPNNCGQQLEYIEVGGESAFQCPACQHELSITG